MSETPRSPTAVRRELGQRLRAMRTGADMTVAEAAEQVGISTSKLTKIELAQLSATRDDVLKLLDTYGEAGPISRRCC
jgi:transcriptional regulator with XRE-family HTH domain